MFRLLACVIRVVRLAALMLLGASFGAMPTITHSPAETAEKQLSGALLGAFVGLAVELLIRLLLASPGTPLPTFRRRACWVAIAYAVFWVIVVVYRLR